MGTNEHLLTITIPTYNRPEKLKSQVRALLPQLSKKVVLIIQDNCSDYNLKELFSSSELHHFEIVKNRVNIGADANIAKAFEYCETKWLWTLSDDDIVLPDAVNTILKLIQDGPNVLSLCFNSQSEYKTCCYREFMDKMKSWRNFSEHYWMSVRVYNISMLNPFVIYCSSNSTTMIAPLIMLLKYLQENPNAICVSSKLKIISDSEASTSWRKYDFIMSSLFLFDIFRSDRKFALNTLFYGATELNLRHLLSCLHNREISKCDGKYALKLIQLKFGKMNCVFSFFEIYFRIKLYLWLPYSFIQILIWLRDKYLISNLMNKIK